MCPLPGGATVSLGFSCWADAEDPWIASGVPAGIVGGLRELGAEVAIVRLELPWPIQRRVTDGLVRVRRLRGLGVEEALADVIAGPELALLRSAAARRRLRPRPDGVVQASTDHLLPRSIPTVTFEDLTLSMALRWFPYQWARVSRRSLEAWRRRQATAYARARGCCVRSHLAATSVRDDYGVPAERVHVVGVGRNLDPRPAAKDWSRPSFLFVGKEWERKNGDAVVRAFDRVRERLPDARLHLVGGHPRVDVPGVVGHGPLRSDRPDERERLEALFGTATCFVMPSAFEPAGIAYAEAAAAGAGSIGTTVGGAQTVVGDAGFLVDPGDQAALDAAVERFCDPATAAELGGRALRRAPQFTWRMVAERVLRALRLPGVPADGLAEFL